MEAVADGPAGHQGLATSADAARRYPGSAASRAPTPRATDLRLSVYLLDTNVVSELRRTRPHGAVLAWLDGVPAEQLYVSAVTLGELQAGVEVTRVQDPERAAAIERWIDDGLALWNILAMDAAVFRTWGHLMHGKSETLVIDAMIAATAVVHRLVVVTRNVRDFTPFEVETFNPFQDRRR